jgi:hypothetical protein
MLVNTKHKENPRTVLKTENVARKQRVFQKKIPFQSYGHLINIHLQQNLKFFLSQKPLLDCIPRKVDITMVVKA